MKLLFSPFSDLSKQNNNYIFLIWISFIVGSWIFISFVGDTHIFPTIKQVYLGFIGLIKEGLIVHIKNSLGLFLKAVSFSIIISLIIVYSSTLPIFKPLSKFISQMRYLPLVGISFYISVLISDGRLMQIAVLVIFMTTFLVTTLLSYLNDIPQEEYNQAKTLGCTKWEILWEVTIKGRLDYVIEAVRQNLAIVWMSIVAVESLLAAAGGLGFLIKNGDKFGNHGRIIALQIIILLIGIITDKLLTFIRRTFFRYSKF